MGICSLEIPSCLQAGLIISTTFTEDRAENIFPQIGTSGHLYDQPSNALLFLTDVGFTKPLFQGF